jgi:hypothetical protein
VLKDCIPFFTGGGGGNGGGDDSDGDGDGDRQQQQQKRRPRFAVKKTRVSIDGVDAWVHCPEPDEHTPERLPRSTVSKTGFIFTHPWAPLGGSMDDHTPSSLSSLFAEAWGGLGAYR